MRRLLYVLAMCVGNVAGVAEEPAKNAEAKKDEKPIKALLVTGGCCHDYDRQKLILVVRRFSVGEIHGSKLGSVLDLHVPKEGGTRLPQVLEGQFGDIGVVPAIAAPQPLPG